MERTTNDEIDVAVIGAGIGGLSAVLALRAAGVDAHAFERAPAIAPLGAALIVRAQSVALMRQWVDLTGYEENRVVVETLEMRSPDGTVLGAMPLANEPDDPGWVHAIHRADLFDTLRAGVPDIALHLGRETRSLVDRGDHVEITFADGGTVRARAVVGADGIRSVVRRSLISQDEAIFSGVVSCRSVAPGAVLDGLPNDRLRSWMRDTRSFALFPLHGGRDVGFTAALFATEAGEESWTSVIDADTVLAGFDDFDPIVERVVRAATGPITALAVHDREPIQTWTTGRVTLLGDAAHPMLPFQGQGANQAVQDAAALAHALAPALRDGGDVHLALTSYEAIRRPATAHFQQKSRTRPGIPGRQRGGT